MCRHQCVLVCQGPGKRGHFVADTLLPIQMFPRLPARTTFVADTNVVPGTHKMFLVLFRNILCPKQMFPSLRSPRNILGNNESATMCPPLPGPLSVPRTQRYTPLGLEHRAMDLKTCARVFFRVPSDKWPHFMPIWRKPHFERFNSIYDNKLRWHAALQEYKSIGHSTKTTAS